MAGLARASGEKWEWRQRLNSVRGGPPGLPGLPLMPPRAHAAAVGSAGLAGLRRTSEWPAPSEEGAHESS